MQTKMFKMVKKKMHRYCNFCRITHIKTLKPKDQDCPSGKNMSKIIKKGRFEFNRPPPLPSNTRSLSFAYMQKKKFN